MHEDAPKINGNAPKCKTHELFSVPVDYHMIMISHSNLYNIITISFVVKPMLAWLMVDIAEMTTG